MEFNSVNHFIDCINKLNITDDLVNIKGTKSAYENINKGCNCSKSTRITAATNSYNNLVNILSDLEKLFLKSAYSNSIIIFKDGQNILGQF